MISKFRFCPNCRKPIKRIGGRLLDCEHCGFHFYLSPADTNALILENDKGEILLTKRKVAPKKGYWDLPGGFIEFKETVEESLAREIKEELGIKIKDIKYVGSFWSYYPYRGVRYQTLCHAFSARYTKGKILARDDISGYKFFPKNKIPFKRISFSDMKQALRAYI